MRTTWLPAVNWTDAPADLNGLVRLGARQNLVSERVPSRSARAIPYKVLDFYILYVSDWHEDGVSKRVAKVIAKLFYQ